MPNKRGHHTHRGYMSPKTGRHSKKYADTVRRVYGGCRVNNPGEAQENKAKCARIAHYVAKKKYGY